MIPEPNLPAGSLREGQEPRSPSPPAKVSCPDPPARILPVLKRNNLNTLKEVMAGVAVCSQCGKHGVALRCSRCKDASYCGAACQKAAWKGGHKLLCKLPSQMPLEDVWEKVRTFRSHRDWQGVIKLEGRLDELMEHQEDATCETILELFADAHTLGMVSSNITQAEMNRFSRSIIRLKERRIIFLGKLQRFRDQGEAMCGVAYNFLRARQRDDAARCAP